MIADILEFQNSGFEAVIDVRGKVRNLVGEVDQLRLQWRPLVEKVLMQLRVLRGLVVAGVFDDALPNAESQVQSGMRGVSLLELLDDAQGVQIMVKAEAVLAHCAVQSALSGVAEWRMTDIVNQSEGLCQVLVQAKRARDRAGDGRNLKGVREAAAEVV